LISAFEIQAFESNLAVRGQQFQKLPIHSSPSRVLSRLESEV
jgi:hypothetical protein